MTSDGNGPVGARDPVAYPPQCPWLRVVLSAIAGLAILAVIFVLVVLSLISPARPYSDPAFRPLRQEDGR